jgi:hypothetical protein
MGKIKGWKKIRESKNTIEWFGIDGDAVKVQYVPNYQGGKKHWLVGANGLLHIRTHYTREEARKDAVNYMRRHPNG